MVKLKRQYNRIAMPVEAFDLLQVRRNVFVSLSFSSHLEPQDFRGKKSVEQRDR